MSLILNRRAFLAGAASLQLTRGVSSSLPASPLLSVVTDFGRLYDHDYRLMKSWWEGAKENFAMNGSVEHEHVTVGDSVGRARMVDNLVKRTPSLVLVIGDDEAVAIANALPTLPMVFVSNLDATTNGLAYSYDTPVSPRTGVTFDLVRNTKPIQWIHELFGDRCSVCVVSNSDWGCESRIRWWRESAATHKISITFLAVESFDELTANSEWKKPDQFDLWFAPSSTLTVTHPEEIAQHLLQRGVFLFAERDYAAIHGAALSFEDYSEGWQDFLGQTVCQVLGGVAPSAIPLRRPNAWYLSANITTLKKLEVDLPSSIRAQVSQVFV
jgi:ABC-type uncharacterized transport system substrate-binding protein